MMAVNAWAVFSTVAGAVLSTVRLTLPLRLISVSSFGADATPKVSGAADVSRHCAVVELQVGLLEHAGARGQLLNRRCVVQDPASTEGVMQCLVLLCSFVFVRVASSISARLEELAECNLCAGE